jgi:hypothetical protein
MIELRQPLAVVCHDAGAANIILAELRQNPDWDLRPVMQGPALALWNAERRLNVKLAEPVKLDEALAQARSLLSGTGWASDLEHQARLLAQRHSVSSVAVIDHWVNYPERFVRQGRQVLPDEIWVTDEEALAIARNHFPETSLQLRRNRYAETQLAAIHSEGPAQPGRVLYLLEPIRYRWPGLDQPGEFEALDFLSEHLQRLVSREPAHLRLRLHPSEQPGKYDAWIASRQEAFDVSLDDMPTLSSAIAAATWVVGCETAALTLALAAGKKAMSCLPPAAPMCRLPHSGLIHLRAMPGVRWAEAAQRPPVLR